MKLDSVGHKFTKMRVEALYAIITASTLLNFVGTLVVAVFLWDGPNHSLTVIWLAAMLALIACRALLVASYQAAGRPGTIKWAWLAAGSTVYAGHWLGFRRFLDSPRRLG